MASSYQTPSQLLEALQGRNTHAREQLHATIAKPVSRLIDRIVSQRRLPYHRELLVRHVLHSVEIYLRTRKPPEFDDLGWPAFLGVILLYVAKMAATPGLGSAGAPPVSAPLPACPFYESQVLQLPWEKVGDNWFCGDWVGGRLVPDGSLWVLLADVAGHGFSAHLLATGLPWVWSACWEKVSAVCTQPIALLRLMHEMLEDTLPEGVFVEATLARFGPDGAVTAVPAGGSQVLVRLHQARTLNVHTLTGSWLGLAPPELGDQHAWALGPGDELLLGSDGLFNQLTDHGRNAAAFSTMTCSQRCPDSLFQLVRAALEQALEHTPQADDITIFSARRCDRPAPIGHNLSPNSFGSA
jgi:hypothetical protein